MIDAAYTIVERVQDFASRFNDVESSMNDTIRKMNKLKTITADSGISIITAARKLIKAGAKENKKKKSIEEFSEQIFIETDDTQMIPEVPFIQAQESNSSSDSNENVEKE